MDFTGEQRIPAPRATVFNALLNPEVLKKSIPNCQSAEYVDLPNGRYLKLNITLNFAILNGSYDVFLQTTDIVEPSHLVLVAEPRSSLGSVSARCAIDLGDEGATTLLSYKATASLSGKVAAVPEIVVKPAVKGMLDQFFKNFDKQVNA